MNRTPSCLRVVRVEVDVLATSKATMRNHIDQNVNISPERLQPPTRTTWHAHRKCCIVAIGPCNQEWRAESTTKINNELHDGQCHGIIAIVVAMPAIIVVIVATAVMNNQNP